jgi:type IV secretion system protein VirD4
MTPTKVLLGQMLVVFGIALAGTWAATQWVAFELGYQQRLGEPWFLIDRLPVYYPWRLFEWWYVYEAYAPDIFRTGGTIAGGSGVVAALSAIVGSVWRARQSKHVTTYGSARWADRNDIADAGLTKPSGVFSA